MSDLADKIRELIIKWRNEADLFPQSETGIRSAAAMRCCANELEALFVSNREVVLGLVAEGGERRSWRGIAWKDSVRASTLAEEIALHFAHDCNDSACGEDADASNCETAWVEDKLTEFLEFVVNGAAAERQMKRGSGAGG